MRRVYLNVATTGVELNDRIIEIALMEEIDEKLTGYRFNCLVNPQGRHMSEAAISITGYSDQQLKQFPVFSEIADSLLRFVGNAELICWDIQYDLAFLNAELLRIGRPEVNLMTSCTIGLDVKSTLKKKGVAGRLKSHLQEYLDSNGTNCKLSWLQSNCLAMAKLHMRFFKLW